MNRYSHRPSICGNSIYELFDTRYAVTFLLLVRIRNRIRLTLKIDLSCLLGVSLLTREKVSNTLSRALETLFMVVSKVDREHTISIGLL